MVKPGRGCECVVLMGAEAGSATGQKAAASRKPTVGTTVRTFTLQPRASFDP